MKAQPLTEERENALYPDGIVQIDGQLYARDETFGCDACDGSVRSEEELYDGLCGDCYDARARESWRRMEDEQWSDYHRSVL